MATERSARRLSRPPLSGAWALVPAGAVLGAMVVAGLGYALAQSVGALALTDQTDPGLDGYRRLFANDELWGALAFSLWVTVASTALAALVAIAGIAWLDRPGRPRGRFASSILHVNLAIPHVVWAFALLLVLSQSGIVARVAAAIGLIDVPASFPVLVRDRYGIGVILHYATKEAPFLALVGLVMARAQPRELSMLAQTLGATGWRRVRLVTLPVVGPGVAAASALVFAFVFGAYEAPVVLGVSSPRMISMLGLDLFSAADLARRPEAMALGVTMAGLVLALFVVGAALTRGRRR